MHRVDICIGGAKAMVGEWNCWSFSGIKAVTRNYTSNHCIHHSHDFLVFLKKPVSLKSTPDAAIKILISSHLNRWMHIFRILYDEMES